jgi:hypothetical protein
MSLELSESIQAEIARRAALEGRSAEQYIAALLAGGESVETALAPELVKELQAWRHEVLAGESSSGRHGQSWRQWIHEGHKY